MEVIVEVGETDLNGLAAPFAVLVVVGAGLGAPNPANPENKLGFSSVPEPGGNLRLAVLILNKIDGCKCEL